MNTAKSIGRERHHHSHSGADGGQLRATATGYGHYPAGANYTIPADPADICLEPVDALHPMAVR